MLFPCLIQVNNSLLPTRVFTSYQIKTVAFWMILICDVVFGLVYTIINLVYAIVIMEYVIYNYGMYHNSFWYMLYFIMVCHISDPINTEQVNLYIGNMLSWLDGG